MDDVLLIKLLQSGDENALEQIIRRYSGYVSAVIINQLGKPYVVQDVEELASDVFAALWQNRMYLSTDRLRGWLGSTARNKTRNFIRGKNGDLSATSCEDDIFSVDDCSHLLEQSEQTRVIHEALLSMGPPDDEIFIRYYYYEQTCAVIAEEMKMNRDTVKSRLRRGREKLKEILLKEGLV